MQSRPEETRGLRLLVADPDLGSRLDRGDLAQARDLAVFPSAELSPGAFHLDDLHRSPGVRGRLHGFLVISGSLTANLEMFGRTCTRVVCPRELVLFDGIEVTSIPARWEWTVLSTARLVLLDERLQTIAARWPPLMSSMLERAAQQTRYALLQQAISQLPRVEDRLLALFWSIADRQGTVRRDGVWVPLDVTHDMLAHMVGAQRPTVSLGLTRLAEAGLLRADAGGWLLNQESLSLLEDRSSVIANKLGTPPASGD